MTTIRDVFRNPSILVPVLGRRGFLHSMSDEKYLKYSFRGYLGRDLDLNNPKGFNEKLQWLKLHDRNPLYTTLVDKYRVKEWVADKIGPQYVTETYAVWESAGDIDISNLPERFVLKTNHDSGGIAICRDRKTFDLDAAKHKLAKHLKTNFFWSGREWPYKNVKPLVFAEEYLDPADGMDDLPDYKLYRFNTGHVVTCAMTERFSESGYTATYFDEDWRRLDMADVGHGTRPDIPMPGQFGLMKELSEKLAEGMPFVRVDFYVSTSRLLFGEMTFYSASGFEDWEPSGWDERLGSWIRLGGGSS